ncbi:MAG: hypothetical protein EOP84_21300 [Verrucomicrobiaceae bacterium]|nr:MAG: hypothetical protein EOP84_21300 [Verrucomicrobiaceae bacterium]
MREALAKAPVGVTSVAGAICLAQWVARRIDPEALKVLAQQGKWLELEDTLSPAGLFPIGPVAGPLAESLMRARFGDNYGLQCREPLRQAVAALYRSLAGQKRFQVFSPRLRHLPHNLEAMGVITADERIRLDPWSADVLEFAERTPYESAGSLVLVPPVRDLGLLAKMEEDVAPDDYNGRQVSETTPFLLGVSEITNRQFEAFLASQAGEDWRVDRVTRAGAGMAAPISPEAKKTNEYHLYHWSPDAASSRYRPPRDRLEHPVTYVSWFAANAYCRWITHLDFGSPRQSTADGTSFRLPTASEWLWVAKGGHADAKYPWDDYNSNLVSYPGAGSIAASTMTSESQRLRRLILNEEKDTRPVGAEAASSFGVFGIIGNVKEWVNDTLLSKSPKEKRQRLILGGSRNLGEASYSFWYFSTLFPENTNPDVGFRVARHLSRQEIELLARNEASLASLVLG